MATEGASGLELARGRVLQTSACGGLDRVVLLPTAQRHGYTLVFLHGYHMRAEELLDLFVALRASFPAWRFVLPQAPRMAVTAFPQEPPGFSWFDYLTDRQGSAEDTVDVFSVRQQREALRAVLNAEARLLDGRASRVFLGGLSQGGCMALDLATHVDVGGVLTMVAPRLSTSLAKRLRAPWHALVADRDEVFPPSWSQPLLAGAASVYHLADNHWISEEEQLRFLRTGLTKFQEEGKADGL